MLVHHPPANPWRAFSSALCVLDLTLYDERGPISQGGDGDVPHGSSGLSFYYLRPRIVAADASCDRYRSEGPHIRAPRVFNRLPGGYLADTARPRWTKP